MPSPILPILPYSRREFLRRSACGFGSLALAALVHETLSAGESLAPRAPMHAPRAKRVIFLFMQGGPSQVDLFAEKPLLVRDHGQPIPFSLPDGIAEDGIENSLLLKPVAPLSRHGQSGMAWSDLLPHLARQVDDLCLLNGLVADNPAHPPAVLQMQTGYTQGAHPALGSWVSYGLGTENRNLPGFVTIAPLMGGDGGGSHLFHSAYLPAIHQGTPVAMANAGQPEAGMTPLDSVRFLNRPGLPPARQRRQLDYLLDLNEKLAVQATGDPQMEGMLEAMELAFRMQTTAPQLFDLSHESDVTQALYGIGEKATDTFGKRCLLARRLVESGVRFVQLTLGGWDHHRDIRDDLPKICTTMDKPVAGLLADLKSRGLLEETLVVWAGEFGRSPYDQDIIGGTSSRDNFGRTHNPYGFSGWLAGGGVRGGLTYGETDDYGFRTVAGRVHVHDLHATILHLLGINHEKLTWRHAGRDVRITDVNGEVVKEILA
ncbi:MAG: DUF1501 domain-containing protein [Planctomycetaceae bacterium]